MDTTQAVLTYEGVDVTFFVGVSPPPPQTQQKAHFPSGLASMQPTPSCDYLTPQDQQHLDTTTTTNERLGHCTKRYHHHHHYSWKLCMCVTLFVVLPLTYTYVVPLALLFNTSSHPATASEHQDNDNNNNNQLPKDRDHNNRMTMMLMLMAKKHHSPSTLHTNRLLSFGVCGGGESDASGGDEHLASQKLSIMHGIALASVSCFLILLLPSLESCLCMFRCAEPWQRGGSSKSSVCWSRRCRFWRAV